MAFLLTGQYMDKQLDHLRGQPDDIRLLFRSGHIYLLFSALANALLGLYLVPRSAAWRKALQTLGSLALLAGPPLLLIGFSCEPWLTGLDRPWARPAIYLALGGTIFHLAAGIAARNENSP